MAQTVVGVFDTHRGAVEGVEELRAAGFGPTQISILAPDAREAERYSDELGVHVLEGGAVGVAAGGILGGLSGWLAGLTGFVIPGAGFLLAAGPLAGALVGSVGGASLGGFIGMLVGLGLPRSAAEEYHREIQAGHTLVVVHPEDRPFEAQAALSQARPLGLHRYEDRIGAGPAPEGPETVRAGEEVVARPSHGALSNPTEHVETAAPDRSLSPSDVAEAIEGQEVMGHTQWLDEADLRPVSGRADTESHITPAGDKDR